MKCLITIIVFATLYIKVNSVGVSKCHKCIENCDEPEIEQCSTEDSVCISARSVANDGYYSYGKGCVSDTLDLRETCESVNQIVEGGFCYICNEDLCNSQ